MANKFKYDTCPIIDTIDEAWLLTGQCDLRNTTLIDIDLREISFDWENAIADSSTLFIGCRMEMETEITLRRKQAGCLEAPTNLPYQPLRRHLYTWQELMEGYSVQEDQSYDLNVYRHFKWSQRCQSINEALWQRLHDFSMDEGLRRLLDFQTNGLTRRKSVGFMGGHGTGRDTEDYRKSARTAKLLTEADYFIVSGGGPGIMEAANLGAYMAGKSEEELQWAFQTLAKAPKYNDRGYQEAAYEVLQAWPEGKESLAIPTWFYGHEPSNLFATYIAKYFSNSIREDTLLAIALYGIVYAPGSAGTTQEIFMEATQNHYGTFDFVSPMVFLGRQRYAEDTMIFPLLKQLAQGRTYADYLALTDEPEEVVSFITEHAPLPIE